MSLDQIKRAYSMKELHPKSAFEHLLQVRTVVNIKEVSIDRTHDFSTVGRGIFH